MHPERRVTANLPACSASGCKGWYGGRRGAARAAPRRAVPRRPCRSHASRSALGAQSVCQPAADCETHHTHTPHAVQTLPVGRSTMPSKHIERRAAAAGGGGEGARGVLFGGGGGGGSARRARGACGTWTGAVNGGRTVVSDTLPFLCALVWGRDGAHSRRPLGQRRGAPDLSVRRGVRSRLARPRCARCAARVERAWAEALCWC